MPSGAAFCGECGYRIPPNTHHATDDGRLPGDATEPIERVSTPASGQRRSNTPIIVVVGVVLLAGIAAGTFLVFGGTDDDKAATPQVVPSETATPSGEEATSPTSESSEVGPSGSVSNPTATTPVFDAGAESFEFVMDGFTGHYSNAGSYSEGTTPDYIRNLVQEYNASGAAGGSARLNPYSPTKGRAVPVSCSPQEDGTVFCSGGTAVRVRLFN